MLTNLRNAFRGQTRSPNMVTFDRIPIYLFIYLFIMSSYMKYKYNNRTQNTGKMKKKLKTTVKNKIKNIRMQVKNTAIQLSQT